MHDMGGWHFGGFGFGHWFVGILIWIVVFALVFAVFKALTKDD